MVVNQTWKRIVPLRWKVAFHNRKSVAANMVTRVINRLAGQPPIPPASLIHLVAAHNNAKAFIEGGRSASDTIRVVLKRHSLDINQFDKVLDFGCGVGRIMRHWSSVQGPTWHGTDYNVELIDWCKNNLKFSDFRVNTLSGILPYQDDTFDFIYAFSVFTHLSEALQAHWISELSRVTKPGGYIYFTTHGPNYLSVLTSQEREQFDAGRLVVREQQESGSNYCAVFHPPTYVREHMATDLTVVDYIPGGANGDSHHDVHLLKKPL
jgi:SAM-dependent methyltransferase